MPSAQLLPNTTQVPDWLLDRVMARLTGAEFKVLLFVVRRTYGFDKSEDAISLTQFERGIRRKDGTVVCEGTGLSRETVTLALGRLSDCGLLAAALRPYKTTVYRLNLEADDAVLAALDAAYIKEGSRKNRLVGKSDQSEACLSGDWSENPTSRKIRPSRIFRSGVVGKSDPQDPLNKTHLTPFGGDASAPAPAPPAALSVPIPVPKPKRLPEPPHPALRVMKEVLLVWPVPAVRKLIVDTVGMEEEALARWRQVCLTIAARGNKRQNIECALDWFRDGIRPAKPTRNGGIRNEQQRPDTGDQWQDNRQLRGLAGGDRAGSPATTR